MEIKKLSEILKNNKVSEIRWELRYFQNGQIIIKEYIIKIKEIRFWDIIFNKYLFMHYIDSENGFCKIILIIDFINEILTNDVSNDKCNYIHS